MSDFSTGGGSYVTKNAELAIGTNESVFQGYLRFEYRFEVMRRDLLSWDVTIHLTDKRGKHIGKPLVIEQQLPGTPRLLQPAWRITENLVLEGTLSCFRGTSSWNLGANDLVLYLVREQQVALEFEGNILLFNAAEPSPGGAAASPSSPLLPSPPAPMPPAPVPPAPDPLDEPFIEPARMAGKGDLFPYVYMRTWPALSQEDKRLDFVECPPAALTELSGGTPPKPALPYLTRGSLPKALQFPALAAARALSVSGEPVSLPQLLTLLCSDKAPLPEMPSPQDVVDLWRSYLALVVTLGEDVDWRDTLAEALVWQHLLGVASAGPVSPSQLDHLLRATLILPEGLFPPSPATQSASPMPAVPPLPNITPYAIGELQMVRQQLLGYQLGGLTHVESVMAGERREVTRRKVRREEQRTHHRTSNDATHMQTSSTRDTSLKREVTSAVADSLVTTKYDNLNTTYGPTTGNWNGSLSVETKPGTAQRPESVEEQTRLAQLVLEKAVERITQRIEDSRSFSLSNESEEVQSSLFDNTTGTLGRYGIYRWLDQVYSASVVNYGNRLLLELFVPRPAARYITQENDLPRNAYPPVPLVALKIESPRDITRERFAQLVAQYAGASLPRPPEALRTVSGLPRGGKPLPLPLPEGYEAQQVHLGSVLPPGVASVSVEGIIGQTAVKQEFTQTSVVTLPMNHERGSVQALLWSSGPSASPPLDLEDRQLTVTLDAAPTGETMAAWQMETFRALQEAYEAQVRHYHQSASGGGGSGPVTQRLSPDALERRELKRGALELFLDRVRERLGSSSTHELLAAYPRYAQFLGQTLEWNELSYSFIPRLAPVEGKDAMRQLVPSDNGFLDFLEADYARLLLPVGLGDALSVLFLLSSGRIWSGRAELVPVNPKDVALVNELKKLRRAPLKPREVGKPWRVVVPTTLSVLQDNYLPLRLLPGGELPLDGLDQDERGEG